MKKLVKLTSMATVATLSMSTLAFAATPETPSIIVDETTSEELVPVRSTGEAYGFDVDWDNSTKTTILTKDGHEYAALTDSSIYEIDHDLVSLGTKTQLINNVTYVPVSFEYAISEDLQGSTNVTDGGNGSGYGGGDFDGGNGGGDQTENDFDFNNPDIDNGFTIDENAGFDFENPDIDNGYTLDENAGFDYNNPNIDNGYNVDVVES